MKDFAAIDFETANRTPSSVCSVGIVIVRDGEITDSFYKLIRPYPNYYLQGFTEIHGLTKVDTDVADHFPEVWAEAAPLIEGLPLVAHNARFDEGCLKAAHKAYKLPYPGYQFYCTLAASRRNLRGRVINHRLNNVARYCGYDLTNHHHALADAEACAAIAIHIASTLGEDAMFFKHSIFRNPFGL